MVAGIVKIFIFLWLQIANNLQSYNKMHQTLTSKIIIGLIYT